MSWELTVSIKPGILHFITALIDRLLDQILPLNVMVHGVLQSLLEAIEVDGGCVVDDFSESPEAANWTANITRSNALIHTVVDQQAMEVDVRVLAALGELNTMEVELITASQSDILSLWDDCIADCRVDVLLGTRKCDGDEEVDENHF